MLNVPLSRLFSTIVIGICFLLCGNLSAQSLDEKFVTLITNDNVRLKGTFYGQRAKAPGILLIHMCMDNANRTTWNPLAKRLQSKGFNVLTLDLRGYGESGGDWDAFSTMPEFIAILRKTIIGDVDSAYRFLTSQKNVDSNRIGFGGASCASIIGIDLAKEYSAIRTMMFLSGPFDSEAKDNFANMNLPVLTVASENDKRAFDAMNRLFQTSKHSGSRNLQFKGKEHGTNMFAAQPGLERSIDDWYSRWLLHSKERPIIKNFIDVDGGKLYYERAGSGEPIVFLGGGGMMDLRQWDAQFTSLRKKYQTISIDPRGTGKSDVPTKNFSNADDLKSVLDSLGIEKATIVGLSYSGGIALEFAITYPERVKALVCSGPLIDGWIFSDSMQKKQARLIEASQKGATQFINIAFNEDKYFIPSPKTPNARTIAKKLITENFDKGFDQSLLVQLSPTVMKRVSEIRSPTLLIAGSLDHNDIHNRILFLDDKISHSKKLIINDAGHIVNLERPKQFAEAIDTFLSDVVLK